MSKEIQDFYKNANVLITGATGFVGLALIEKLLRCIPDIGKIFLLIRPKRGVDVSDRLEELKKNSVFDKLKEDGKSDALSKLAAVTGDVGDEGLGLSTVDKQTLIDSINVIFHCAATLDFESNLVTAVNINLLGTKRLIELGKQFKNLRVLVHVSSAYVNSDRTEVEEMLYAAPASSGNVIELVNSLDVSAIDEITPKLLKNHPNTYTFTKSLAEHEVAAVHGHSFAVVILRPSMILGCWKQPIPGWTISKNGPQGFLMGASKGIIRRLPVGCNLIYDYIPVDIVVNYMVVAACHTVRHPSDSAPVYHITTSTVNPFRWNTVSDKVNGYLHYYPLKGALWYPRLKFVPSLQLFRISAFIFHILPALALDTLSKLTGGRPILLKLHRNVNRSLERLAPFIFNEWHFNNDKALSLCEYVGEEEETFYLSVKSLDWEEFFKTLNVGVRTYLHKESMGNIHAARRKDRMLYFLNIALQIVVVLALWAFASLFFKGSFVNSSWILPLILLAGYIL